MQSVSNPFLKLGLCLILASGAVAQAQEKKADPSGTWTWTTPARDGGAERKSTLTLKVEGTKLVGKLSTPGRDGGQAREIEIGDGKVTGDEVTFTVTREYNNNKMVAKYTGKVTADAIKGKVESERGGQTQSRDWEAKREAAKK